MISPAKDSLLERYFSHFHTKVKLLNRYLKSNNFCRALILLDPFLAESMWTLEAVWAVPEWVVELGVEELEEVSGEAAPGAVREDQDAEEWEWMKA